MPNLETGIMADRSNFWKMVDRTKPSKLRVFVESELRDCEDYFLEIQSDSTLPPSEIITASERLALLRSEIDIRHSDAKHRQTQRLARWAIAFGMVSMAAAITSGVAQFFAHQPTHETLLATGAPIVATPSARELLTPTQELTAMSPAAMPELSAPSLTAMPELSAASLTVMPELSAAPSTVTPELTPAPMPRGTPPDIKPEYVGRRLLRQRSRRPKNSRQLRRRKLLVVPAQCRFPQPKLWPLTLRVLSTFMRRVHDILQARECALSKSMREAAALPAP